MNTPASLAVPSLLGRAVSSLRQLDAAVAATAALLGAVALLAPWQLGETLAFTAGALWDILPFLLVSVAAAAWLKAAGADRLIGRALAANQHKAIVLAALLGALSPFCSCGVIPVIGALLASGVPLAPVMAFWVSSPIMSPDMYVITAGALGFGFATAKALAAVFVGLTAGFATVPLQRWSAFARPTRRLGCSSCGSKSLASGDLRWAFWKEPSRSVEFIRESWRNGLFLGKWLLLAFVLESLMLRWLPADLLAAWVGDNTLAIPIGALVGVPAYLNGFAAVPVVAGLIQNGMAPGAGLAFMVAGSMTSIPAAVAVFTLVRRPVFVWYVLLALVLSVASGYGYALWLSA